MITVLELGRHRNPALPESVNMGEFERTTDLPFFGGCEGCGASMACYNSYPSKTGFLRCKDCIGDSGWETVEEANKDIFEAA